MKAGRCLTHRYYSFMCLAKNMKSCSINFTLLQNKMNLAARTAQDYAHHKSHTTALPASNHRSFLLIKYSASGSRCGRHESKKLLSCNGRKRTPDENWRRTITRANDDCGFRWMLLLYGQHGKTLAAHSRPVIDIMGHSALYL